MLGKWVKIRRMFLDNVIDVSEKKKIKCLI